VSSCLTRAEEADPVIVNKNLRVVVRARPGAASYVSAYPYNAIFVLLY